MANNGLESSAVLADDGNRNCLNTRHCERSEAIQTFSAETVWIASSQGLLAMTGVEAGARKFRQRIPGGYGTSSDRVFAIDKLVS